MSYDVLYASYFEVATRLRLSGAERHAIFAELLSDYPTDGMCVSAPRLRSVLAARFLHQAICTERTRAWV